MRVCASGQVYFLQNLDVFGKLNDLCFFDRCRIQASYTAPSLGSWVNWTLFAHLIELLLDDPDPFPARCSGRSWTAFHLN